MVCPLNAMPAPTPDRSAPAEARADAARSWPRADVAELEALLASETRPADVPSAVGIERGVPVYAGDGVRAAAASGSGVDALMAEWRDVFEHGAGVVLVRNAWTDESLARADAAFAAELGRAATGTGDHFAVGGANVRVWNAHERLALADPAAFVDYASNEALALASLAWLGPGYQVTAQLNLVRPGGAAQAPHRDYHMGFRTVEELARYPMHAHRMSAALTLQGAVAHADMPLESGPTQLLPHSQRWAPGYLATGRDDVRALFAERRVQLPLARGDALFFNPALIHAAGENVTAGVERLANLFQVSSAFGRAMEIVDRYAIGRAVYPELLARRRAGCLDDAALERTLAAGLEGYAFPANLELRPPVGGLAPETPQDLARRALGEGWEPAAFDEALDAMAALDRSGIGS